MHLVLKQKKNLTKKRTSEKNELVTNDEDDDFNPTLAAMESEIKPKVLKTVNDLN